MIKSKSVYFAAVIAVGLSGEPASGNGKDCERSVTGGPTAPVRSHRSLFRGLTLSPGALRYVGRIELRDDGPFLVAFAMLASMTGSITADDVFDILGPSVTDPGVYPMLYQMLARGHLSRNMRPDNLVEVSPGVYDLTYVFETYRITESDFTAMEEINRLFQEAVVETLNLRYPRGSASSWWRQVGRFEFSRYNSFDEDGWIDPQYEEMAKGFFEGEDRRGPGSSDDVKPVMSFGSPSAKLMAEFVRRKVSEDVRRITDANRRTPHDILDVAPDADRATARRALARMAMQLHPDFYRNFEAADRLLVDKVLVTLNWAWERFKGK